MSFLSALFCRRHPLDLTGMTDWHCHILPGVDDGVPTIDESLAILDEYAQAGIAEVWLTPHVMEDMPNTTVELRSCFDELKNRYSGPVALHLASENMLDNLFRERLDAGDLLPIGHDGKTLLIETSYFNAPFRFRQTIDAIKAKGYYPLLAHPERYNYIDSIDAYRKLRDQGILFQLNLMSLCGYYGPMVKKKALRLLAEGMYDRAGTDLHRHSHLRIVREMKLPPSVSKHIK